MHTKTRSTSSRKLCLADVPVHSSLTADELHLITGGQGAVGGGGYHKQGSTFPQQPEGNVLVALIEGVVGGVAGALRPFFQLL